MKTADGDVSVPITWAYNHHFEAYLKGSMSEMRRTTPEEAHKTGHSYGQKVWQLFMKEDAVDSTPNSSIPVGQWFSEGNGGEYRKSYHGYPKGMAQLIESPVSFQIEPMQIDTRNRDYNGTDFRAGPLPKASAAPPNASYSGLLECPCADRIPKNISVSFSTINAGSCKTEVHNSEECFDAARKIGVPNVQNFTTIKSSSFPTGCSFIEYENNTAFVYYNTIEESSNHCGGGSISSGSLTSAKSKVSVKLELDASHDTATITLSGPSGKWYSVAFDAPSFAMSDLPYTVVVDGNGNIAERKLGNHNPGTVLKQMIKTVSDSVADGVRTVVMQRSLKGATADHYTFDPTKSSIPLIFASGTGSAYAYHGPTRSGDTLNLASLGSPTCVCYEGVKGSINGIPFSKNCLPEPKGDLLAEKNPTCFVDTYEGGLACCHHEVVLLDKEQVQPKEEMTYHMKFRFWFQEYSEENEKASHQNLIRVYWQTEALAGEYDVLKCDESSPSEDCVFTIHSNFTVRDMMSDCDVRKNPGCWGDVSKYTGIELSYAAGHCHAPSCLLMELWNADTNELLCRHDPVYGKSHEIFDELGYLAIPPCLFGPEDQGLVPPTYLSYDTNLYSIKKNINTAAHLGEMASWQMRGVLANKK